MVMRSCMLQWKADSPAAVLQDSGRAPSAPGTPRLCCLPCENQWLQTIVWSQKLMLILRGTGVWLRNGKWGTVFSIMEILWRQRAAQKAGLDPSQSKAPMPSFGHVWRRLSHITLTNVRGEMFSLRAAFIQIYKDASTWGVTVPESAGSGFTKQTVEH